jgi:alkylmercury lyase
MMAVAEQVRETETRGAFADYLKRRVPATNTLEMQRLSLALYRLLGSGTPTAREQLAAACSVPQDRIEPFLREFLPSAVALDDRGAIIAFSGLSLVPTHHRFAVDGTMLFTWCAFDALFLAEILGKPATLITQCPGSGAELTVELAPGELRGARPADCVLSIVTPDTKACCDNLRKAFCDHVNLFKDEQTFRAWSRVRGRPHHAPGGAALCSAPECAAVSRSRPGRGRIEVKRKSS